VWANLIGVVLAALAVGYWLAAGSPTGGPSRHSSLDLVAAAALVAATPFVARPFSTQSRGPRRGVGRTAVASFLAVVLVFAPPVVLLGRCPRSRPPRHHDVATAGAVAGRLYALSTFGSLVGTFVRRWSRSR